MQIVLTPEVILAAYREGIFPMADNARSNRVHWICPEMRGQISIPDMHIPKRLKRSVRQMRIAGRPYEIHINRNFEKVIHACAKETLDRPDTWINSEIVNAYCTLHRRGYAHSVECYQDEELVGGLYGLAIGAAFFGESMFSRATDASKVSLVHLVARLHEAGFELLDTQFTNPHLVQFGVYELAHHEYVQCLEPLLDRDCRFDFRAESEKDLILRYFSGRH